MLTPTQQAIELIQKSKNILIALPENLSGDDLGCALALEAALKQNHKKIDIVSQEPAPAKLNFLPGIANLKNQLAAWRDFIITIDTSHHKISRLRYETEDKVLKIFLTTPQKIAQHDVRLDPGPFYYDLIITIDAPDLESLGPVFENNTELFFGKPIINIDHKAANENFGEVNLVEPTAAACAEIVAGLIEMLGQNLIDGAGATALLMGLIIKTHSFQNTKTTPQSLNLASRLITQGANQEEIIRYLYKTKPLNCLRLWGRLLSQLEFADDQKTAWLTATSEDFTVSQTSDKDLIFVFEELFETFPQIITCLIIRPDENGSTDILIQSAQPATLQKISAALGGTLKNNRLIIKTEQPLIAGLKNQLTVLLN